MFSSKPPSLPHPSTGVKWEKFNSNMGQAYESLIKKKGHLKEFRRKEVTTVEIKKTIPGFNSQDIQDLNAQITRLTQELNEKIHGVFCSKVNEKIGKMKIQSDETRDTYGSRSDFLNTEISNMSQRCDYLKTRENQMSAMIENCITHTKDNSLMRRAFNG